jgi:hypothetical protein
MFMLYALVVAVALGLLLRGRLDGLTRVRFHWAPVALLGMIVQVTLFSTPLTATVGDVGPPMYVASTAAVLVVVLRNVAMPGLAVVAVGAASNLAAIVANGGWMPASSSALANVGTSIGDGYSNSRELAAPALAPLTDIFAMPRWLPFANVFSIGDVVIAIGIVIAIVAAMRVPATTTVPPAVSVRPL